MGSNIKEALDQYFWSLTFQILQSFTCEVGKNNKSVIENFKMTAANNHFSTIFCTLCFLSSLNTIYLIIFSFGFFFHSNSEILSQTAAGYGQMEKSQLPSTLV